MKYILGTKLHMTQVFDTEGVVHPVTVVAVTEPIAITALRTKEKDGYEAVQVGYGTRRKKRKSPKGEKKEGEVKTTHRGFKEFRGDSSGCTVGDTIEGCRVFHPGDMVRVVAVSKGKGFQGVVKRYGFGGGPRTHGQKTNERQPGSIGSGLRSRVPKGQKMPGRMGSDRVTIKGTRVMQVDEKQNVLLLRGSIPGRRGTLIEIQSV